MSRPASTPAAAAGFGPAQPVSTDLSPAKPDAHRDHATLSPSSAARWLNCPPSAKLNAEAGDRDTVFTREGSLAHTVAELKARKYFLTGIGPKKYEAAMAKHRADELWQDEIDAHTDRYLEILKEFYADFPEAPHVAVEQRVDFGAWVPDGFGTADCIMVSGDTIHIVDFKYGKGVQVSAEDNPQMKLYALGALAAYELMYDLTIVRMSIIQPRLASDPDTWETSVGEIVNWAEQVAKPAAALAAAGEGEYAEGEWCRFCAIRGSCRARAAAQLALEDFGEKLPPELTDEEVAQALIQGKRLAKWLSEIEEYALRACLDGKEIPGFKAVEGRSVRVWTDADAAFLAARAQGIPEEMLYERKPITLAAMEKLMGKRHFLDTMAAYVTTPPGKPTLVPETDKRPAITDRPTIDDDFGDAPGEGANP